MCFGVFKKRKPLELYHLTVFSSAGSTPIIDVIYRRSVSPADHLVLEYVVKCCQYNHCGLIHRGVNSYSLLIFLSAAKSEYPIQTYGTCNIVCHHCIYGSADTNGKPNEVE
ncbi:hypothetical protein EWB00_007235 [Schistosoma japonicum]|uniref:Uncharacterized protein n=1 Tax=Schistosoma japonicum TaxID=6182 RepID=A0A4Z2CVK3_SCHJA|nr:hypothetical protein EWB00_007235 [Schistosoma japonicum]